MFHQSLVCFSRPGRQFVPASERYPASQQKNRQESRMKRQAELLALQGRTCLSRTNLPPPPRHHLEPHLSPDLTQTRTSPSRKVGGFTFTFLHQKKMPYGEFMPWVRGHYVQCFTLKLFTHSTAGSLTLYSLNGEKTSELYTEVYTLMPSKGWVSSYCSFILHVHSQTFDYCCSLKVFPEDIAALQTYMLKGEQLCVDVNVASVTSQNT